MKAVARLLPLIALVLPVAAVAQGPAQSCDVPAYLLASDSALPKVGAAIRANKLDIAVIGSRSSTLTLGQNAYPSRLQDALRTRMPNVAITVSSDIQPKLTADEVKARLGAAVAEKQPALVIWQTGTVDAMRAVDPDEFRTAVDEGVGGVQTAGADIILMNLQYSPRTESMTPTAPYIDNLRAVAQERSIPLFDRFAIMRHWNDNGEFDLFNPSPGADLAQRVHGCIAQALASFVVEAARSSPSDPQVQR